MKRIKIGIVMDPIGAIRPWKDTTLGLMLEAQKRGWELHYMEIGDLRLENDRAFGRMKGISVSDDPGSWFEFHSERDAPLSGLDIILMRKDPPFDMEYIMATYILERAEAEGVLVANRPRALRDINEKVYTAWFSDCCPPGILTRSKEYLLEFLETHGRIVVKPTCKMGGKSIYVISRGDPNTHVILEDATHGGTLFVQAQAYIPNIREEGDKRILLIDGQPVEYGLTRIPRADDHRGNLATGATGRGIELSDRDRWICGRVGPVLREQGVVFAGLDIIGEYLTEINITSPTCIREIEQLFPVRISAALIDALENRLQSRT
jgi:glutathione synthase